MKRGRYTVERVLRKRLVLPVTWILLSDFGARTGELVERPRHLQLSQDGTPCLFPFSVIAGVSPPHRDHPPSL
jgi:hypothetical protein